METEITEQKKSVVEEALKVCECRLSEESRNRAWIEANQNWLEEVGLEIRFSGTTVLFYNPTRPQVIRIIREIGGKWNKRYNATTITYNYHLPDHSQSFILCDSQPPGTCRMIPVVQTVPAHWEPEKVINTFKLQCKEEGEAIMPDVELPDDVTPAEDAEPETGPSESVAA